jgi:hypothetical protein
MDGMPQSLRNLLRPDPEENDLRAFLSGLDSTEVDRKVRTLGLLVGTASAKREADKLLPIFGPFLAEAERLWLEPAADSPTRQVLDRLRPIVATLEQLAKAPVTIAERPPMNLRKMITEWRARLRLMEQVVALGRQLKWKGIEARTRKEAGDELAKLNPFLIAARSEWESKPAGSLERQALDVCQRLVAALQEAAGPYGAAGT